MVIEGLGGKGSNSGQADWIVTGVAVLCIAAFSPVVMLQGLRFTHATAGTVARGWIGTGASIGSAVVGIAGGPEQARRSGFWYCQG